MKITLKVNKFYKKNKIINRKFKLKNNIHHLNIKSIQIKNSNNNSLMI